MASTFTGLNISTRALYSSLTSLYTANSNISNASDKSYTRQIADVTSGESTSVYYGKSVSSGSMVNEITRQRNARYDENYRTSAGDYGEWYTKSKNLSDVEGIFDETSDSALSGLLSSFESSLQSLTENPESSSTREEVIQSADSVCTSLNTTASKLMKLQSDTNADIKLRVDEINSTADQLSQLNSQIAQIKLANGNANSLMDQQDKLIDRLSEITDVKVVRSDANSQCQVLVGGSALVDGSTANHMSCVTSGTLADGSPSCSIQWKKTGSTVATTSGELKALTDLRDGDGSGSNYNGVPYYLNSLNTVARNLARAVNEGTASDGTSLGSGTTSGYGLDGSTGTCFFTYSDQSTTDFEASGTDPYANISAATISVSSDVTADSDKIGASTTSGSEGNGTIISGLIDILNSSSVTADGTVAENYSRIVATEGSVSKHATLLESHTLALKTQAETTRESVTSVSVDEESNNLVQYQKIYEAASKMISVWQEIYAATLKVVGG